MSGSRSSRQRGQPLVVLVALLACWGMLRAATWSSPLQDEAASARPVVGELRVPESSQEGEADVPRAPESQNDPSGWLPAPLPPVPVLPPIEATAAPLAQAALQPVSPRLAAGHAMMMAAGFAQMRVPPELAAYFSRANLPAAGPALAQPPSVPAAAPVAAPVTSARPAAQSRWSADGWLMWRDDSTTPVTSGRPSYGRSQMGAVVRYELAPGAGQRPQAYLRGSAALQGAREQEVAVGLSARPLARVPLRAAAELRASDRATGSEVRPAAYVVTEMAPQSLPAGLVAEAYAQAGYVGGRVHTAFADGQARVDRSLASAGDFDLRAGAAAWGGAQRGGARLDVGPSASLAFQLGQARGRVAADYRFRVAGDADPASGPALTLSAGF